MAKSSIGDKQVCPDCETKFFDLGKKSATCPKCGAVMEAVKATSKSKPKAAVEPASAPAKEAPESDEDEDAAKVDLDLDDDLVEDDEEDDDEEEEDKGLMEDASDLSDIEDEMSQVHVHVEGSDREGS